MYDVLTKKLCSHLTAQLMHGFATGLMGPIGRSVWTGFVEEVDSEVNEVDGEVDEVDDGQGQLRFATIVEGHISRRANQKKN